MTDETDTTSEVARVLTEHQVDHIGDNYLVCRRCGGLAAGTTVTDHQGAVLAEAGLLSDHRDCAPLDSMRHATDAARHNHEWGQARLRERDKARAEAEAFGSDLTALREGLMERIGRYTPSDADLLAYVDGLRAQIATQEPAERAQDGSGGRGASGGLDGAPASGWATGGKLDPKQAGEFARILRESGCVVTHAPASGGLGERLRALGVGQARTLRKVLRTMADEADEVEAAYRVADAEIARLSEFHDHHRAQVERVRQVADMAAVLAADMRSTPYERALAGRFDETIRAALDGPADALLERIGQVLDVPKRATGGPVTGKNPLVGVPEGECEYLVPGDFIIRTEIKPTHISFAPELQADLNEQIDQWGKRLADRIRSEMGLAPNETEEGA